MNWFEHTLRGAIGFFLPLATALYTWQEHLEWVLQIMALVVSIIAGLLAIWPWLKKFPENYHKLTRRKYRK